MNKFDDLFNFKKNKNNLALISDDRDVTYSQLHSLTEDIKSHINQNSLVLLVCKNTIDSIVAYLGILKSGAACVMIKERNFSFLLETYNPKFVFAPKEIELSIGKKIFEMGEYALYENQENISYRINKDLSILLSTSGSTGTPKFVKISYKNIISNTESILDYLQIKKSDRAITTMPMNYSYGLSIINTHLSCGASIVVTEASLVSRELWNLMKSKNVTNFGGVPYSYEMLKKLRFERLDLPSLRYITQAGGKLDESLTKYFYEICYKKGINFIVMYGQTEATARISYLPKSDLPKKIGSIGIPIPGGKLILRDDNGKEIKKDNEIGELTYFGDNVCLGYSHNCFDLDKKDENEGCLETGDLAYMDNEGYFFITGRKNRFIKVFGNRVNLDEFQKIVQDFGLECVCSGEDDLIKIFVTNDTFSENELFKYLMQKTGLNKSSYKLIKLNAIPRNESGKVLYSQLK